MVTVYNLFEWKSQEHRVESPELDGLFSGLLTFDFCHPLLAGGGGGTAAARDPERFNGPRECCAT